MDCMEEKNALLNANDIKKMSTNMTTIYLPFKKRKEKRNIVAVVKPTGFCQSWNLFDTN